MNDTTRRKKRRIMVGLILLPLLVAWIMVGGLLLVDSKQYEASTLNDGSSPIHFRLYILATHVEFRCPGFVSWSSTSAPYRLVLIANVDVASPYEKLVIQSVSVTYPDGSIKRVLHDGQFRLPLKTPESRTNPREFTTGGRPEDMKEYFGFDHLIPVDLQLDFKQHRSCSVQLNGVLSGRAVKQTPVSISARFKAVRQRHAVALYVAESGA